MSDMIQSVSGFEIVEETDKFKNIEDLTTYGALSCELAFLQSFAICFTLVDQSVERKRGVVTPTVFKRTCKGNFYTVK